MANEKRLIYMVDTIEKLRAYAERKHEAGYTELANGILKAANYIHNNIVRVDAVEVVHGEWSTIEDDYCGLTALQCSECNQEYWFEDEPPIKIYNYCPNCGAKMDGDGND